MFTSAIAMFDWGAPPIPPWSVSDESKYNGDSELLYPDPDSVISYSVTDPPLTTTLAVAPFQTAEDGADASSNNFTL